MSQLFNFSFQTLAGAPDSPGAINKDQVVYAYATQSTKTLLVFTNGESRIANNTLASVKSTFGLTSIGTPTNINGQIVYLGEVLVNQDYVTQVSDRTSTRVIEMNQPASAPVNFTTSQSVTGIVSNCALAEKGYKEWVGAISVNGTNAPTGATFYNTMGVAATFSVVTGGNINGIASTAYWKIDFSGIVTSSNIAQNSELSIVASNQTTDNNTVIRVSQGTIEEPNSFVIAAWNASTTNVGVTSRFMISIKFFA